MEIDSALTAIQTLRSELQDAKLAAASVQLKPLPGESVRVVSREQSLDWWIIDSLVTFTVTQLEKCAQDLGSTSKSVGSSMAQLLTCAAQGNEHYTGWSLWSLSLM